MEQPSPRTPPKRERESFSPATASLVTPTSQEKNGHLLSLAKRFGPIVFVDAHSPSSSESPHSKNKKPRRRVVRGNLGFYNVASPSPKHSDAWHAEKAEAAKTPTPEEWIQKLLMTLENGGGVLDLHEVVLDKLLSFKRDLLTLHSKLRACGATALAKRLSKFYKKNKDKAAHEFFERAKIFALQLRHENKIPHMDMFARIKKFHLREPLTAEIISNVDALPPYQQKLEVLIASLPEDFFLDMRKILHAESTLVSHTLESFSSIAAERNDIRQKHASLKEKLAEANNSITSLEKNIDPLRKEVSYPLTQPSGSSQSHREYEIKKEERTRQQRTLSFLEEECETIREKISQYKETLEAYQERYEVLGKHRATLRESLLTTHQKNWTHFDECLLRLTHLPVQVVPPPQHQLLKPPTLFEQFLAIRSEVVEGILSFMQNEAVDRNALQNFITAKISALQTVLEKIPAERQKAREGGQKYISFVEGLLEHARNVPDTNTLFDIFSAQLKLPAPHRNTNAAILVGNSH